MKITKITYTRVKDSKGDSWIEQVREIYNCELKKWESQDVEDNIKEIMEADE